MSDINPTDAGKAFPFINIFAAAFLISSMAGLARLLRSYPSKKKIPMRMYISVFLSSGILGLIISLLWYHVYEKNVTFLLGISALAGIGGMSVFDFLLLIVKKKIGIKFELTKKGDEEDDSTDSTD